MSASSNIRATNFPPQHSIPHRQITQYFRKKREDLEELEEEANSAPDGAEEQYRYLTALNNSGYFQTVLQRVESNRYAHNKKTQKEYERARNAMNLANSNLLTANNQYAAQSHTPQHHSAPLNYSSPYSSSSSYPGSDLGSRENPLYVTTNPTGASVKPSWGQILLRLGSAAAFAYFAYYLLSQSLKQLGSGGPMSRQFKEYQSDGSIPKVTFEDVKGCDEAKAELEEVVAYLKNPAAFQKLGGRMPKGLLLTGPPGTGKTLLARAIAGEAEVPFFSCSGSEFEEIFVGVGAKRIRELFAQARKKHPCIIFIDEIDAVGSRRSHRDISATRASLNQLLTEMDGFEGMSGVIVIGATNLPEFLDPALVRPGRFDRHVVVPVPDIKGRKQILDLYASKVPMASDVDLQVLARGTPGTTGADLFNIVNSAALRASANKLEAVTMKELEYAKDKILMGAERVSHALTDEVRKMTAYHEGQSVSPNNSIDFCGFECFPNSFCADLLFDFLRRTCFSGNEIFSLHANS
jgi:ATP-dependent metalloprotease